MREGRDQHRPGGELQQVQVVGHHADRSGRHPRAGQFAAREEHGILPGLDARCAPGSRHLPQGPALEDKDASLPVDAPLDILGPLKMRLQRQGDPGQFQGLVIRERGLGPLGIGLHPHPFLREAHGFLFLVPDLPLEDRQGLPPGDDPQIRADRPVHHGFGQPVHPVDQDGVAPDVGGVPGIHHPPAGRIHHGHAAHAHGHVFVPEPLVQAVAHRGQGIFAGHDLLIDRMEVFLG